MGRARADVVLTQGEKQSSRGWDGWKTPFACAQMEDEHALCILNSESASLWYVAVLLLGTSWSPVLLEKMKDACHDVMSSSSACRNVPKLPLGAVQSVQTSLLGSGCGAAGMLSPCSKVYKVRRPGC